MRLSFSAPCLLLLLASLPAQTAEVTRYGSPCPANVPPLVASGLPRLGTVFTLTGINGSVMFCTQRGCFGPCRPCNRCGPPVSIVMLGASRVRIPLLLPGFPPGGCTFLASPDVLLQPGARNTVDLRIPRSRSIAGTTFYLQRIDLILWTLEGQGCTQRYTVTGFALSDGLEARVGF